MTNLETTIFLSALRMGKVEGLTFTKVDLSTISDFSGKTNLWHGAILPGINLTHTDLRSTLLLKAVMHNAILTHTDIGPKADCSLSESDWQGTDLSGSVLTNSTLTRGIFTDVKWANCVFDTVALSGAYFNGGDMSGARFLGNIVFMDNVFAGVNLCGADLSRVIVPDWSDFDGEHGITFNRAIMDKHTKMPRGFNPRNYRIEWA